MHRRNLAVFIAVVTLLMLGVLALGFKGKNFDSTKDSTTTTSANPAYASNVDSIIPINSFPTPDGATRGLAFDGTFLWSADGGDGNSQNGRRIYKLDPNTGATVASYDYPGMEPNGLAWDGQYLWHSDHGTGLIYKLDPSTVTVVDSITAPGGFPFDIAFDDGFIYMVQGNTTTISKIDTSTGTVVDTVQCTYPGAQRPFGLTVASTIGNGLLVVADDDNNTINERDLTTSEWINQWLPDSVEYPCGLAFDPATNTLWLSCWTTDSIYVFNVVTGIEDEQKLFPTAHYLSQNYPNPFNPKTTIKYGISKSARVRITIFDILGRRVATLIDDFKAAGNYQVDWNGSTEASGIYFYEFRADRFREIRKMVLMK